MIILWWLAFVDNNPDAFRFYCIGWGHGEEPLALLIVLGTFLLGVKWIDVYLQ
jgi:hypothetical protein